VGTGMKDLSECTILIVDDIETNIDILLDTLGEDYDIAVAMDGASALESIEDEPPDLILLDIMMPDMDGYEVCEKLKSNPKTTDIPVIFLSALSEADEKQKGLNLGAVDFITKPFDPSLVQEKVKQHLTALNKTAD
jgi:putative two-component system response regulator